MNQSTPVSIHRISESDNKADVDLIAVEEPLEIQLIYGKVPDRICKSVSITMRTPGDDLDLALGFLFTEGILRNPVDILSSRIRDTGFGQIIEIELHPDAEPAVDKLDRNFYATSSCGVCGKASLGYIRVDSAYASVAGEGMVSASLIYKLPERIREHQSVFKKTGGLHASAIFDLNGALLELREDVGRHNALDKLIGSFWSRGEVPLRDRILLLSGRISFELVQKAAMAGISIIVAIGAPSSLALRTATDHQITLIGFVRETRFNIYSGANRVRTSINETADV